MKKLLPIIMILFFTTGISAQYAPEIADDTTRIKTKNRIVLIIKDSEDDFDWEDEENDNVNDDKLVFSPTIDLGMNGYVTSSNNINLPSDQALMELDFSKSRSVALNAMLKGADILNKRIYFSPGIGLNWTSYTFKNNVKLPTTNDTTEFFLDTIIAYDRYKLKANYLQVPLVIGIRLGQLDKTAFGLQLGISGGYNIGAKIKQKYSINDTQFKHRIKDDYNINPFKIEAMARLSIGQIGLYAKYSVIPLFQTNKAPALYPFSFGFTVNGF